MLMQNFMSAADLNITEEQKDALCKTLVVFETGKVKHVSRDFVENSPITTNESSFSGLFNMRSWGAGCVVQECGTIACIGGTAELLAGKSIFMYRSEYTDALYDLFFPSLCGNDWYNITVEQASQALRNYLTNGKPDWKSVMEEKK